MEPRIHFNQELNNLYQHILKMGALVEEAMNKSVTALATRDTELARLVIEGDADIDRLQVEIEDEATTIIARESPVATDLRELITSTKIVGDLERIGDHARHIAKAAINVPSEVVDIALPSIEKMAQVGIGMIHDALTAFAEQDAEKARVISERDDQVDAVHRELYEILVQTMKEKPEWIHYGVNLLFLNRYLERLGDHVTNMCEWVVFAKTGEHVELNK